MVFITIAMIPFDTSLLLYIYLYFAWCGRIYAVYWHRVLACIVRYLQFNQNTQFF